MPVPPASAAPAPIEVRDLTMAFGSFVVQQDLTFEVPRGRIFVIMGGSGCGKSTLLKHMLGLLRPAKGEILYSGEDFWGTTEARRRGILRGVGVLYQGGALWSSLTLAENVALPLGEHTDLPASAIRELVALKLRLVGLGGFEDYYPFELSGGMRKRAGLARAIALDPDILFFDEPSAGLDPPGAHLLDRLILELRDGLGATVVMVTHELASIFAVADDAVFLDAGARTMLARGAPRELLEHCDDSRVIDFLTRGAGRETAEAAG
jgi:phospholipid/cholesterol/gamma-HCH transport system ATP-binding protein